MGGGLFDGFGGLRAAANIGRRGITNILDNCAARFRLRQSEPNLFYNLFPEHEIGVPKLIPVDGLHHVSLRNLNYVVLEDGTLFVGKRFNEVGGGHIDLSGGNPVRAAGELRVVNGEIRFLDNASGHYLPVGRFAQSAAEEAFQRAGFDVTNRFIHKEWRDGRWRPISQ